MLKQKELKRASLIEACIEGKCTVKQVANALGLSERRVKQIKKEVKMTTKGCARVIGKNSGITMVVLINFS